MNSRLWSPPGISIILLIVFLVSSPVSGQTPATFSVTVDKSLSTYHWIGRGTYDDRFGPWTIRLDERFLSTLIRTDRNQIRDEQVLDGELGYDLSARLRARTHLTSFALSDDERVGIGNASSHAAYAGFRYSPWPALAFEPMAGWRIDNQLEEADAGPSVRVGAALSEYDFDGYRTSASAKFHHDKLDPRTVEIHADSLRIEKEFSEGTGNVLSAQYHRNRRDFYIGADSSLRSQFRISSNLESRSENAVSVRDSLRYGLGKNLGLTIEGDVFARSIKRDLVYRNDRSPPDPRVEELRIGTRSSLVWRGVGEGWFTYQERDERHGINVIDDLSQRQVDSATAGQERKNNQSKRTALGAEIALAPSSDDRLLFSASSALLRYDTPALENDDDRDELRHALSFTAAHRFNSRFDAQLTLEAHLVHLVYLSARRSADNTWNRIFALSPRLSYSVPRAITTVNTFEVLANYTVYDFEFLSSSTRSFVYRQFAFTDSTIIPLGRDVSFEWFNHLRIYERGELRWSEFTERPLAYFEDNTMIGSVACEAGKGLHVSVGIRYFSQSRSQYIGAERFPEHRLKSLGPLTAIRWDVGIRTRFAFRGWYEAQRQTGQPARGFANFTMDCHIIM